MPILIAAALLRIDGRAACRRADPDLSSSRRWDELPRPDPGPKPRRSRDERAPWLFTGWARSGGMTRGGPTFISVRRAPCLGVLARSRRLAQATQQRRPPPQRERAELFRRGPWHHEVATLRRKCDLKCTRYIITHVDTHPRTPFSATLRCSFSASANRELWPRSPRRRQWRVRPRRPL